MNNYEQLLDKIDALPTPTPALVKSLRVVVRARVPTTGEYLPATTSGVSGWETMTGDTDTTRLIIDQRRKMEDALSLVRYGMRPVSGFAALYDPPGLPKKLVEWLDSNDELGSLMYGGYVHVLKPEVLERTLFILGDSNNVYQTTGKLITLTPEQTVKALLSLGMVNNEPPEIPYIEGLILNGLNFNNDLEVIYRSSPKDGPKLCKLRDRWEALARQHKCSSAEVYRDILCGLNTFSDQKLP